LRVAGWVRGIRPHLLREGVWVDVMNRVLGEKPESDTRRLLVVADSDHVRLVVIPQVEARHYLRSVSTLKHQLQRVGTHQAITVCGIRKCVRRICGVQKRRQRDVHHRRCVERSPRTSVPPVPSAGGALRERRSRRARRQTFRWGWRPPPHRPLHAKSEVSLSSAEPCSAARVGEGFAPSVETHHPALRRTADAIPG
jgi:hypothetical protein